MSSLSHTIRAKLNIFTAIPFLFFPSFIVNNYKEYEIMLSKLLFIIFRI